MSKLANLEMKKRKKNGSILDKLQLLILRLLNEREREREKNSK